MGDKSQLQDALQAQYDRAYQDDITDRVVDEIKSSVIFEYNWQDLLQSSPVALSSIGSCFVACSSDTASTIKFDPPPNGFKFLQNSSLRANLVDCGNLGRFAFLEAENGMGFIKQLSKVINNKVADLMGILADPDTARTLLKPQMAAIKRSADDCYQKAAAIDKKFEDWLLHASELHSACVQEQSTTDEQLQATTINMAVAQTKFESQKGAVETAKATTDKLGKQLDVASEAYKKASDQYPSGWDILGQQIVGSLAECATTALSQAITAYTANMNPVAKASTGANLFNDLVHGGKNAPKDGQPPPQIPPAPPQPKAPVPPNSDDPAYTYIKAVIVYLNILQVLLTSGPNGGVDWDKASGADKSSGNSASFVYQMLDDARQRFSSLATSNSPSNTLKDVLNVTTQIANEVNQEAAKGSTMGHTPPDASSDTVKRWQNNFQPKYGDANRLLAIADTLPGAASGGPPLMADLPDPKAQIAAINAQSTQAQATLEAAQNRLQTTQQTFGAAQDIYQKASGSLLEQQNKLTEVQAELTRLTKSQMSLSEIKTILISCIELIITVKSQIMELCRFFSAISATIEAVVNYTVQPFLDQITASTAADGALKTYQIGSYQLTDLQRSLIYNAVVTIQAYFGVFGDIATMWNTLSQAHIMPGVNKIDELSTQVNDPVALQSKVSDLQKWSVQAQDDVRRIAQKAQEDILDTMNSRLQDIEQTTRPIPPSPHVQAAIEAGATEVKVAAVTATTENTKSSSLGRFSMKHEA